MLLLVPDNDYFLLSSNKYFFLFYLSRKKLLFLLFPKKEKISKLFSHPMYIYFFKIKNFFLHVAELSFPTKCILRLKYSSSKIFCFRSCFSFS